MAKLNQIIAVEKGVKSRVYSTLTDIHKLLQKPDLFGGFHRTYQPKDEDGETVPPETKRVQSNVRDLLKHVESLSAEYFQIAGRKDWTNAIARSDVTVDGTIVLKDVPVTYLLFLEKQITDLHTMFLALPVLDEAEAWTLDEGAGLFRSEAVKSNRTKKVAKPIVLLQPTPEHPGQAQLITDDIVVGTWTANKQSGAIPRTDKIAMVERAQALLKAIKEAREAANGVDEVPPPPIGKAIFGFLLPK